jgi:NAD(P)-dependent dehydrogenase (short-subunit alcohol dehydrogenase family)
MRKGVDDMGRFEGKVALVTGAASGIGRATAILFAQEGARVLVDDINDLEGEATVALIGKYGGEASYIHADVSDSEQCRMMIRAAVDRYGGLDILHANAGVPGPDAPIIEHLDGEIRELVDVNLIGVIYSCRAAIDAVAKRGGGSIVITSSLAGLQGPPQIGVYAATKAGVIRLTEVLACECAALGIRVNAVAPGVVETPMLWDTAMNTPEGLKTYRLLTPLGRLGKPEDIAKAVAFLASDDASWITGIVLSVDGGAALRNAGGVVFRYVTGESGG